MCAMSLSVVFGVLSFASIYACASGTLQHEVALVGHNATFDCITSVPDPQILWDHKSADRTHSSKLMDGLSVKDNRSGRIVVDHNITDINGSRLFIDDIKLTDAGTYSCINGHTGETQLTAELTVIAKETSCYTNIASAKYTVEEDEHVLVTCNISSYGALVPNVTCDIDSNLTQLAKAGDTLDSMLYKCYRWKVKATTAIRGSRVMCNVWFEHQQETFYNNTWTSPAISLAYGPHSVTIHPQNQTVYEDGDQLECTAEGNPPPHYHWTAGNVVENGQTLTVDACKFVAALGGTPNTRILVKCIADRDTRQPATTTKEIELAFNYTQLQQCVPISRSTEEQPRNGSQFTLYLVIGGVAAVVFIIVVGLLIGCCRLYQRERSVAAKRAGLYTPNNPIYDEAHDVGHGHYSELPGPYYSRRGQYEEIDESAMYGGVVSPGGPQPLPYQHLAPEQREPNRPPGVYRQLGDTPVAGYIDMTESTGVDTKPTPYQKLESESRDQPAPPGEYRHLGDTPVDSAIPTGNTHGYIDVIDDDQRKSVAPSSYQKLKSDDLPQQPAPPSEYNKLSRNVVDRDTNAVYSSALKNPKPHHTNKSNSHSK